MEKPPTVSLPEAARLLGIGKATAYQHARAGTFPTPVIKVGGRVVVPTAPLLEVLHLDELPEAA